MSNEADPDEHAYFPCGQYLVPDPPFDRGNVTLRATSGVTVSVPDLTGALKFYVDVLGFGWRPRDPLHELAIGRYGKLVLVQAPSDWEPDTEAKILLDVSRCGVIAGMLRERGVRCDDEVTSSGEVTWTFYDPFGNGFTMFDK